MSKRILITGGAGMVGSHAAEYYAKKNYDVIILDNLMRSQLFGYDKNSVEYNWHYLDRYSNITKIKGDIRNKDDVRQALSGGIDIIIHTAGQPGVGYSIQHPEEDYSINAFGTFNVLECARQICPKAVFIYCSTNKVYGENVKNLPLIEEEKRYQFKGGKSVSESMSVDHCGHTPYGSSKYMGDIYTQEYGYTYGLKTCVLRMSCIFGTRQFGFEDQGWLAWFIIAALTGQQITIYGDGKQVRDVLYVEDLVRACDAFAESGLSNKVYNIGGGIENTLSLLEFVDILEQEIGNKINLDYADWRLADQKVYISDISKIKKELNWKPKITAYQGIKKIMDWVDKNKGFFK